MKITKTLLLAGMIIFAGFFSVSAQEIVEGPRNFLKNESQNALSMVVVGQLKNVEAVLDKKFEAATGVKPKAVKGVKTITGASYARMSANTLDMFYKVETATKTDENLTRVNLFLSSGNGNFINSQTDAETMRGAADILKGLQTEVSIYEFELAIEEQTKVIDKAIKDHERMVSDSVKLENKLAETLQEIENNKISRRNQLETIEQEKIKLSNFQSEMSKVIGGKQEGMKEEQPAIQDIGGGNN
ncbi:MAG: hypothetical protein SF052_03825 [Bacteroidia bacterium]|nr:hypothetical protein [Bacteroidia bacterium]